ncbi:hypothetical protein ACWEJ6_46890 [Nonomuraea sp. NPDC004702]
MNWPQCLVAGRGLESRECTEDEDVAVVLRGPVCDLFQEVDEAGRALISLVGLRSGWAVPPSIASWNVYRVRRLFDAIRALPKMGTGRGRL